jgi:hypothetical protein
MATLTLRDFDNEALDNLKQATGDRTYSGALRTAAEAYPHHVGTIRAQQTRIDELEKELSLVKRKVASFAEGLRFLTDTFDTEES